MVYDLSFIGDYSVDLPEKISIETPFGTYQESYKQESLQIKVTQQFELYAAEYALEIYPDFYAFINNIKKAQRKSAIVLTQ